MSRRLTALLCALCLLTGCGASTHAGGAASSAPAEGESSAASSQAAADNTPWEGSEPLTDGSAAGLKWSFSKKKFSTTESSGREVYYYGFVWPVFSGEDSKTLNGYVNSYWLDYMDKAEQESGVDESYLDGYTESMDAETLNDMLPFYDLLRLDTVWANEEYVSISGLTAFWSGGAHPYSYRVGSVVRRSDASVVELKDLVDLEQLSALVREHFPEDAYADEKDLREETMERIAGMADSPEAYALEEGGLRLYYNVGDALPRLEILLPTEKLTVQQNGETPEESSSPSDDQ